jgi:leucyl/phenylalanyl-tRNA--protein transferase
MPIVAFPDPRSANADGLVAVGGDLHPESLLLAYRQGIFPWPVDGMPLLWFCPEDRAILEFADLHVPRSLARGLPGTMHQLGRFGSLVRIGASSPRETSTGIDTAATFR